MDNKKIISIACIVVVAIVAVFMIINMGGNNKENISIECYKGRTNKEFEDKLLNNYKELRKFTKETGVETASKNYESYNLLETFNEEYFQNKKVAVISIYEDDSSVYEYHIDGIKYNEDKTTATIEFTNKNSGYEGNLSSSWINTLIVELEGTVTTVNFSEITE